MKIISLIMLFSLIPLTGCLSTSPIQAAPAIIACEQPGTVQSLALPSLGGIGIYLPPCYNPHASRLYPVLYLLPGFGGTSTQWFDYGLAPLTDKLILGNEIPPFIIVTTDNTYDHLKPEQIVTTLIPYIESHYRTSPARRLRSIAGGSLGAAAAYLLAFQHPDLFSSAGIFGNGLTVGQEAQDEAWLQAIPSNLKPRIFLNDGDQDTYMQQQAKALIPYLDKYKLPHTEVFTPGNHSNAYWLTNFPVFFHWLAQGWN
jgi:enterochelin esterase-like enzyme